MIYNNTISDIRSNILEPWRMCGEYEDGFDVTVGGGSEEAVSYTHLTLPTKA